MTDECPRCKGHALVINRNGQPDLCPVCVEMAEIAFRAYAGGSHVAGDRAHAVAQAGEHLSVRQEPERRGVRRSAVAEAEIREGIAQEGQGRPPRVFQRPTGYGKASQALAAEEGGE
jgi:hypothetical protein